MKVLFIHGMFSHGDCNTRFAVENCFSKGTQFIAPNLNTFRIIKSYKTIKNIIENEKPDLIIGHSLGGFYNLLMKYDIPKLLINPCVSVTDGIKACCKYWHVPGGNIFKFLGLLIDRLMKKRITSFIKNNTFAIFALEDELLKHQLFFEKLIGIKTRNHIINFSNCHGQHRLSYNDVKNSMNDFFQWLKIE